MRLTNVIRDAFVRAAMQDVPSAENYEEQAHKLVVEDSINKLPEKLKPIARDKKLKEFLETRTHWFYRQPFGSVTVFGYEYTPSKEVGEKIAELAAKKQAEDSRNSQLQERLKSAAYSVTTRKALVDLLPEFEKYLPADEPAAIKTLPAIANLVTDFTKAGWPKDKQQSKAA